MPDPERGLTITMVVKSPTSWDDPPSIAYLQHLRIRLGRVAFFKAFLRICGVSLPPIIMVQWKTCCCISNSRYLSNTTSFHWAMIMGEKNINFINYLNFVWRVKTLKDFLGTQRLKELDNGIHIWVKRLTNHVRHQALNSVTRSDNIFDQTFGLSANHVIYFWMFFFNHISTNHFLKGLVLGETIFSCCGHQKNKHTFVMMEPNNHCFLGIHRMP